MTTEATPAESKMPIAETAGSPLGGGDSDAPTKRKLNFGLDRFSGLYVWAVVIVVFSIWVPDTFLKVSEFRLIAGNQAITAMLAMGLILPIAAGVFDLSSAAIMGFVVTVCIWCQVHHWNLLFACVAAIVVGLLIGVINGFIVVNLRVNSFIGTLGMSSILGAAAYWVTNGQQVVDGISPDFLKFGTWQPLGIPISFYLMIILAIVLYITVEYTPVGRYFFAVGGNPQAARLAGVRVNRIIFSSLVASAGVASVAGVILAANLGSSSTGIGPPYLLPAFSAVYLGATQIKAGRVNVLGTLVAIYLLATGVTGLQLAGAPAYVPDLFNGVALIIAVAMAARTARKN